MFVCKTRHLVLAGGSKVGARWRRPRGPPAAARGGCGPTASLLPLLQRPFVCLLQPRDVTNFTVAGFTPMSPRITSPMHPSGAGECWGGAPEDRRTSLRTLGPS